MARVPYLHRDEAGDQSQPLYDRLEAERSTPTPNIYLALAHAPDQLDRFLSYANALRSCNLSPLLRELIVLTVGHATGCDYEVAHHQSYALAAGLTVEQVKAVPHFETADVFDDFEKAVMRLAREFSEGSDVRQETWDAVAAHLTTQQLVQLTLLLAWYVSGSLMMRLLALDLEEGYSVS
ncbi:carboxymuconolactone decarboxylase [Mycobacterium triplex]|uniref:Carboxymuconolactone decarboxylase n=1 Tax=Mycobacterium triplex TaxID=47839 RepID=A0A024JS41_9MYCO|nr:carboxymuconolactone decarboxylase family protein [Mycobacterium triplex]ORW99101.1 carboxymuconolactone decarboxylase [Mycobacterium triplex]CDO86167.1 carboxymuconolactone decarboxylase [Mycobacterium triplex]